MSRGLVSRGLTSEGAKSGTVAAPAGYPAVGSLINGKYLVEKIIGEGGVGVVIAAQNVELGERVALKFLKAEMLERSDVVGRFMHEAKAACSIRSEHSATVFDVGRTSDGVPFLVMELLEGKDLSTIIGDGELLDARSAAEYGMQVCDALAGAHAKGIVHRDIKPENLFLETRSGLRSLKVLDFGISKTALTGTVLSTMLPLVQTQSMMGTPLYMSPEQVRAPERVDPRTDIWSLGVVLFEALTGRLPIQAESITELCAAILESPLDSISQYRHDLPEGFIEVVEKCLEKDVAKRYQNVAELAFALMPFAPKRARICAERAAQVLVAAGMVDEESVRFPSAMPPASTPHPAAASSQPFAVHSSGAYALAPPPSISNLVPPAPPSEGTQPSFFVTGRASVPGAVDAEFISPRRRKMKVVAAMAIVVGLAGAFVAFLRGSAVRTDPPGAPAVAAAPMAITPAETAATEAAPQAAPSAAKSAPPPGAIAQPHTKSALPVSVAPRGQIPAPRGVVKPVTTSTPVTTGPASAKKPDAIDIGY
jgi:eukaryotic-like serine/threonine-protein kinase